MASVQDVVNAAKRLDQARNQLDAVKEDIIKTEESLARLKTMRATLATEVDEAKTALRAAAAQLA